MLAALPGHAKGLGDARHRHMMNDQPSECPAHRCARELGARIGRLAHVLAPHMGALWAPVAAHAHVQDRGAPPAGLVRQAPDHRVTRNALASAASTPPVLTSNTARQHCMVCLNALTRHLQPQVIQARERAQVRAIKGSIGHVEVFQMDGVGISIIGRPRPLPGHDTPNPAHNTYTLKCEQPLNNTSPPIGSNVSTSSWACAQVVDGLFMRLLSRTLGVVRIRWGICRRGWCGCGGGCRSLRSRWRPRCRPGRGW